MRVEPEPQGIGGTPTGGGAGSGRPNPLDLPSAQPIEGTRTPLAIGRDLAPRILRLPKGTGPMRILEGEIQLDAQALRDETGNVTDWLNGAIRTGDQRVLGIFQRALGDDETDAIERSGLENAFERRNPERLDALRISDTISGIAERNIIRRAVEEDLQRFPFILKDRAGNVLTTVAGLDIVFVREEVGDGFKFIIGSERGIETISFPDLDAFPATTFRPDLEHMERNEDVITIPLRDSADGTTPTAHVIEIRKGARDLFDEVARAEATRPPTQPSRPAQPPAWSPAPYYPPASSGSSRGYSSM